MATTYGVTVNGFVLKRMVDIEADLIAAFQNAFGPNVNLDPSAPMGMILGIFAEEMAGLWEGEQDTYNSQYPDTASGVSLDNVASITGAVRKAATFSTVTTGTARGTFGTIIPIGTVISVLGNPASRFATTAQVTIDTAAVNEVQQIAFGGVTPDNGSFALGFNDEITVTLPYTSVALDVQNALNGTDSLSNVTVTGTFSAGFTVTFAGNDGGKSQPLITIVNNTLVIALAPVTATVTETTPGDTPKATGILLTAQSTGPIQAPAGTLSVIETAVAGLNTFTNETDAVVGSNADTDAQLKARRINELQSAGKGTLNAIRSQILLLDSVTAVEVFQNNTNSTDAQGRPPHSVDVVVQNGDAQTIANKIFDVVAAGISFFGDTAYNVIDSEGFTQVVKFSRPTDIPIYIDVQLTTDLNTFPIDGYAQAKAAIIAYGETLGMGDDVIVIPKLVSVLNSIPGITGAVIKIGKTASPTSSANIDIQPREIADFDTSRTSVHA